jgi:hypothetical protein
MVIRAQVFYLVAQTLQNSESAEIMGELNARSGALFRLRPAFPKLRRTGRAHLRSLSYPGLKRWAILYNRFAVKSGSA